MLVMMVALTRLPKLSRQEFHSYWFDQHGPLVKHNATVLGILEYVQLHSVDDSTLPTSARRAQDTANFDGVAQIWFANAQDFSQRMEDPLARIAMRELVADERKFIDLGRSKRWWGVERRLI